MLPAQPQKDGKRSDEQAEVADRGEAEDVAEGERELAVLDDDEEREAQQAREDEGSRDGEDAGIPQGLGFKARSGAVRRLSQSAASMPAIAMSGVRGDVQGTKAEDGECRPQTAQQKRFMMRG